VTFGHLAVAPQPRAASTGSAWRSPKRGVSRRRRSWCGDRRGWV